MARSRSHSKPTPNNNSQLRSSNSKLILPRIKASRPIQGRTNYMGPLVNIFAIISTLPHRSQC